MSVWLLIVTVVLVLTLILRLAMNAIKKLRKMEEDEHPCGTCVRWSECNGVDDECPWR